MEILALLFFAFAGGALMKRNGMSWIEGALWGGILTIIGLVIIYFRIRMNKRRKEGFNNLVTSSEAKDDSKIASFERASQEPTDQSHESPNISLVLKQKAINQLLFGLTWWSASAIAMYFALASVDRTIFWFGGALGALFHWYRVLKLFEFGRIQRIKFLDQKEFLLIAATLIVVVGSASKIVPEYFRMDVPTVGTCWAHKGLNFYTPIACWSDQASLKTIYYSKSAEGCGTWEVFGPKGRESQFTCLEKLN